MEGYDTESLEKLLVGCTIVAVEPLTKSEGHFTLVAKKGEKKQRFDIYATDMGWWFQHKRKK